MSRSARPLSLIASGPACLLRREACAGEPTEIQTTHRPANFHSAAVRSTSLLREKQAGARRGHVLSFRDSIRHEVISLKVSEMFAVAR